MEYVIVDIGSLPAYVSTVITQPEGKEYRLSEPFGDVISADEIHRLCSLRRDGFPERLRRSYRLVQLRVGPGSAGRYSFPSGVALPKIIQSHACLYYKSASLIRLLNMSSVLWS